MGNEVIYPKCLIININESFIVTNFLVNTWKSRLYENAIFHLAYMFYAGFAIRF